MTLLVSTTSGGTDNGNPLAYPPRTISILHLPHPTYGEQMKTYMVYPPNSYAFEVHAYNEMAAREQARFYLGVEKLPKGTEFFEYN